MKLFDLCDIIILIKMVNACLIIMLLTNLFRGNTGQSLTNICTPFIDIKDQNIPIKAERKKLWKRCLKEYNTSRIHTIEDIYEYLRIASRSPYGHVKVENLTLLEIKARSTAITNNGNYIPYVNISTGSYVRKPTIVVVGGTYARDWLTVAAAIFVVEELVLKFETNYDIITKSAWIIVPVLNPDGYAETMLDGSVRSLPLRVPTCSKPFSEIESSSLKDTISLNLDSIKMFVTLIQRERGYSYPFTYTEIKPLNYTVFENILKKSTEAAHRLYHRTFDYGHIVKFEKKSAGGPSDWIKAHFQVELAFTLGISYFQNNHYILSTTEIEKTKRETFAALKTIASLGTDHIEKKYTF